MKRRNFLRGSAISLLALPAWLGCAFQKGGSVDVTSPEDVVDNAVGRAFLQAQKLGKPLMVVVVPADTTLRYERGHAWGEYLNHGGELLWPLALCEVMCANTKEISEVAPVSGEPLFVLLEGEAGGVKATVHDAKLPSMNGSKKYFDEDGSYEKAIDARIQKLGELVKNAVAADADMIKERRAFATVSLGKEQSELFAASLQKGVSTTFDARFDTYAAIVADVMTSKSAVQNVCKTHLVQAVEVRLKNKKIEGSRWTQSSGCGPDMHEDATAEEREQMGMFDCGMGFVPAKSSRFLTFYTSTEKI